MSGVPAINDYSYLNTRATEMPSAELTVDDFYTLLAAQMKYQDADNPMDTAEMMSQMVQTMMIEAITEMQTTNTITYAASMMGKEVNVAELDEFGVFTGETTTGVVSGVLLGDNPILYIGDKPYYLAQVMGTGTIPPPEEAETDVDVSGGVDGTEGSGDASDDSGDTGNTESTGTNENP